MHDAAKVGDEASLKRLIEEGANVNEKDGRGISPLGVAVGFNRIACVKALLAAGADVHQTDARGSTVLHYAAGGPPCPDIIDRVPDVAVDTCLSKTVGLTAE